MPRGNRLLCPEQLHITVVVDVNSFPVSLRQFLKPIQPAAKIRDLNILLLCWVSLLLQMILRDNLIRTLKLELKRSSQQTKSIIAQNVHCNDLIVTQREMIERLQVCLPSHIT